MSDYRITLPDNMPDRLKEALRTDVHMFGTCYYEETTDGYERIDPLDIVDGA